MGNITVDNKPLDMWYSIPQQEIFSEDAPRYNVVSKGRRLGATHGAMQFVIECLLSGYKRILWVDTIHSNIDRYIERYGKLTLKNIKTDYWSWKQQKKELHILDNVCDFRSADRPENLEGFGYEIIILNEAGIILSNRYLWLNAIRPMTLDYGASVWFLGTPKGKRSKRDQDEHQFYTLFKRGNNQDYPEWRSLQYSSYDNPLLDKDAIKELEAETPSSIRRQEIDGCFVEVGSGDIFKREWWRRYDIRPTGMGCIRVVQSWDTAYKDGQENDYTVCTTWLETVSGYYLIDMWRGRPHYPNLVRILCDQAEIHKPDTILIEDKASGQSLLQTLRVDTKLPILAIKPDRDKLSRANACTSVIESGRVYLPRDEDYAETLIDELSDFPQGGHDDITDSVSQALNFMKLNGGSGRRVVTRRRSIKAKTLMGY